MTETDSELFCITPNPCISIQNGCIQLKRMINALIYYSYVDVVNSNKEKDQFLKFCNETYVWLLNDYIHIIDKHDINDIDYMKQSCHLFKKFEFISDCNVNNCLLLSRHYRDRNNDNIEESKYDSNELIFHRDLMDSMHTYLIHLYDIGMRVKINEYKCKQYANNKNDNKWVDYSYAFISQTIKHKQNKLRIIGQFNRRITQKKFTIHSSKHCDVKENDNVLLTDDLLSFLEERPSLFKVTQVFRKMLITEEFDSDAIKDDMNNVQSNLKQSLGNELQFIQIKEHIYQLQLHQYTIAVGYRFEYESEVFFPDATVPLKYITFKHEILNNQMFSLKLHQLKLSIIKTLKYIQSEKVKQMKHNFDKKSSISFNHLLSICLYCDWTELSTSFSSTFRKHKPLESLSAVVKRNQEFYHFSKWFTDTIQNFGSVTGLLLEQRAIDGPFFCGMDHMMVIPQFYITLSVPTSTSKSIEVAEGFGGDHGVIVQLNNKRSIVRSFGSSWISNYSSENEWIFCEQVFEANLRIEAVILQDTQQNFSEFCLSLYFFDQILSGYYQGTTDECTYSIISNLIKHKLKTNGFQNHYPKYINDTFQVYTNHKSKIVLDLKILKNYHEIIGNRLVDSNSNVFQRRIFDLFPNIQHIAIKANIYHPICMYSLLNVITDSSVYHSTNIKIEINCYGYTKQDPYVQPKLDSTDWSFVLQKFDINQWNIVVSENIFKIQIVISKIVSTCTKRRTLDTIK
eukprot:228429_1